MADPLSPETTRMYPWSQRDPALDGLREHMGSEARFIRGDLVTSYPTGTDHGTPYWYDRHIEMMMLGPGVTQGTSDDPVYSVDFAPTLAGLGHIPAPDDLDGRRLFP